MYHKAIFKVVPFFANWEIWLTETSIDFSPVVAYGPWPNGPDEYEKQLRNDLSNAARTARSREELYALLKEHCFEIVKY